MTQRARVLLVRRSQDADWEPGRWELPGGKLRHGEDLANAVMREVYEETGLRVTVGSPFCGMPGI